MPKRARCPHCDRLFNRDILDSHIQKCRARNMKSIEEARTRKMDLVLDGNNIAFHLAPTGKPKVANLVLARQCLVTSGYRPVIVVSAALIHKIDKPDKLLEMIGFGHIIEAPRGKNDDLIIIQTAQRLNADIVSNDRFLNWRERFPWISDRLRRYRMTPSGLILT